MGPHVRLAVRTFIFAYGSLISADSRGRTGITSAATPITISGFERGWYVRNTLLGYSAVAVIERQESHCNGVLFELPQAELDKFDQRELRYVRMPVEYQQLGPGALAVRPEDSIWIYVAPEAMQPDPGHPIPLSYVDVMLHGCLEFGSGFAHSFVAHTRGWNGPWLNDRESPRYVRPSETASRTVDFQSYLTEVLSPAREITRECYDAVRNSH